VSAFPVLKTGAVAQYPSLHNISYATQVLRFLDGSEQRVRDQSAPLRRWVIQLEKLDDTEMAAVDEFLVVQQGALEEFAFTDPWSGAQYAHCSLERDAAVLEYVRHGFGRTALVVTECRD
jgi:hypothetical protein